MKRGDIVIVDFPFADGSASKKRPAVVVLADTFGTLPDTILASVSTTAQGGASHVLIDPATDPHSGLRVPCGIRCEKLHAVEKTALYGTTGSLWKKTKQKLDDCLRRVLGL